MQAFQQDGYGLEFAYELRSNWEVVMEGKRQRAFVQKPGQFKKATAAD